MRKYPHGRAIVIEKKKRYVGKRQALPAKERKQTDGNAIPRRWIPALCAGGLVVLAILLGCIFKFGGTVYPNVTVCGIEVGGMGRDVAIRAVESAANRTYGTTPLSIRLPDRTLSFRPELTKITVDANAAVDDALRYGREGGPISCLIRYFQCKGTSYSVDVTSALRFEEDAVRELVTSAAHNIESVKKQPEIEFDKESGVITVVNGCSARHLDADALYNEVVDAYAHGEFEGRSFDYEISPFDPVDLTELWKENCTPAEDASYDEATHALKEEVSGYGFDLEKEQQRIAQAAEGETITIRLAELVPEVTVDSLEKTLFPDVLGEYDSPHTDITARTNNLIRACNSIDGKILNPGEVFSFNKTVGERTAANGYEAAIVYTNGGKSEMELGGGVCQVASTIYLSALLADLNVVQREAHMYAPTYVPFGMDATVYWGSLDFRFKNSTASPLRIRASVSNGYVHVKLLGVKESAETIKMTYTTLSTIPWEEVEEVDETKPADFREVLQTPYTGYKVQTYKNYYDENGELLRTEKCAFSSYRKRDKIWTVGKPEAPVDAPVEIDPPVTPADPETEIPVATPDPVVTPDPAPVTPEPQVPAPETPVAPVVPNESAPEQTP